MAKLSAPNPAIFTSDPLEQIFAKGVTARNDTAGIAGAMMLLTAGDRMQNQDRYMGALNDANKMDAELARHEAALKLREQGMKSAVDLIKEGFAPSTTRGGPDLFTDTANSDVDLVTQMNRALTKSKIFANMQKGAGGGGTKESTTVQQTVMPWGAAGPTVVTSKSANPANAYASGNTAIGNVVADMQKNPQKYTPAQKQEAIKILQQISPPRGQPDVEG